MTRGLVIGGTLIDIGRSAAARSMSPSGWAAWVVATIADDGSAAYTFDLDWRFSA